MSVLSTSKDHNKLYYNSKNSFGKQTYAYIKTIEKSLLALDTESDNPTSTQWVEIAEKLNIEISDLIDKNNPDFKKEYGKNDISLENSEWLKILDKEPSLVTKPILFVGDNVFLIEKPSDIVKLIKPDSAGLEKPYNKKK